MPTIALVDDDRNILTSVSIALEAEGYRVATYTDGDSALEGFRTTPPNLAILDIKMPRMDGMEFRLRLGDASEVQPCAVAEGAASGGAGREMKLHRCR